MSDDDVIFPDSVDDPDDDRSPIDELAQRAVGVLLGLLRRANALAGGVLIFALLACVGGYLLGIAALDGGALNAWIFIGGLGALWAIGSVLLAMWRLAAVRRGSGALVDEVRGFLSGDNDAQQTVLETVEVSEGSDDESIVAVSRQFFSFRDGVDEHGANFTHLAAALRSLTSFPALMALAVVMGFAFAAASVVFILILIF